MHLWKEKLSVCGVCSSSEDVVSFEVDENVLKLVVEMAIE